MILTLLNLDFYPFWLETTMGVFDLVKELKNFILLKNYYSFRSRGVFMQFKGEIFKRSS